MSRISIDVTPDEHKRLKAMAALQGKSIKDFVIDSTLGSQPPASHEATALAELEALLDKRLDNARAGGVSSRTVGEIFEDAFRENDARQSGA